MITIAETEKVKERAKNFLTELGVPVTAFCQRIGISAVAFNRWQRNDLKLADETVKRISDYLLKYGF